MCFSATASFIAGGALLAIGTFTLTRVQKSSEIPFAAIPLLFGIQQVIEGALWLTFPDKAPWLNTVLTYAYSLFSHVLWPVFVPIAVLLVEPAGWRRKIVTGIFAGGVIVALYLLFTLITQPISALVEGRHITYVSPHFFGIAVVVLYVLGTCISSLFSSHKHVRIFGILAFMSFAAAYAFYATWFISVWCFFAAIISGFIILHFLRPVDYVERSAELVTRSG